MAKNQAAYRIDRFRLNQLVTSTGSLGNFSVRDDQKIRIVVENADVGNIVVVSARIKFQTDYTVILTVTGSSENVASLPQWDEFKVDVTNFNPQNNFIKIIASGF